MRMASENGKGGPVNYLKLNPHRPLPLRVIQIFVLFLVLALSISIITTYVIRRLGVHNVSVGSRPIFIQPCNEEEDDVKSWIKPPGKLMHKMNDTELLWRASFAPRLRDYPFKRKPKIAFMFLAKGPLPLAPLWERFFAGYEDLYSIYIHSLPSYVANYTQSSVFYNRQVPSQMVEWGMMSMCEAERRLLANALLDISNEWFVLVSESCIPLHNFNVIYRYISRSLYSFMGSYDEVGPDGRGRYNELLLPEVSLGQWRKGSQWFEVNRDLALQIIQDVTYYPKYRDFCKPPCYVDEHYFPTMLSIQVPHLLANRTLTWTDWSRGGAHPATYGKADIKEGFFKKMLDEQLCFYNNQPMDLCYLFARKFAPSALEPLLGLASTVFGY